MPNLAWNREKKFIFSCKIVVLAGLEIEKASEMKRYLYVIIALLTVSCAKEDMGSGEHANPDGVSGDYMAILTVKKTPTDTVFFQLNDSTTIYAANYQGGYTRMERVYCDITVTNTRVGRFNYSGKINWIESLDEGRVTSDASVKGADGLDIINDWMTSVEDGYLTLHYSTWWGANPVQHDFYLVTGTNPSDPYEVVLKQNSNGDKKSEEGDSLICFDINSLPHTGGLYKTLTLKWTTSGGSASEKKFKFKTRE